MARRPENRKEPETYPWDFHDFNDWCIEFSDVPWPSIIDDNTPLSTDQKAIVLRNKLLLENRDAWNEQVWGFESWLISNYSDEPLRDQERSKYEIRLDCAEFRSEMNLNRIKFPCATFFNFVKFRKYANFSGVNFNGKASFFKTEFNENETVSFDHATFTGDVEFTATKFSKSARFHFSIFKGDVYFNDAYTCGEVNFFNAVIDGSFDYRDRKSVGKVNLENLKVAGQFKLKSKLGIGNFQKLDVGGAFSLSGSEFETVPDFRDSKLDRPPEVAGMIVPPPDMVFKIANENGIEERHWPFKVAGDKSDVAKYRKLKAMALAANDHEKDGEFFAYEMMAKRGHETTGFFPLLLNSLYWLLSFYGQSVVRPFLAMLTSWFFFWLFYIYTIGFKAEPWERLYFATIHSIQNIIPLIGSLFRTTSTPKGHTSWYDESYLQLADKGLSLDWWAAISAGQQIIGAVLFFLLFLGLRNKFRLK